MKILILLRKKEGGVGTVVGNVSKEFKKKGHLVEVISREENLGKKSLLGSILPLRREVRKLMQEKKFDIIYTHDWSLALPLIIPFQRYKQKHFCMFHGNEINFISKIMQKLVGKILGPRLFVVGPTLKRRFQKSHEIYNGVNLNQFKPLGLKRKFLGWIDKDTEVIGGEDVRLLAKKLGLQLSVAKKIPYKEMNTFYNLCEVFISLPPHSAGFNLCWLEAIAAGVPVVIGNQEGIGKELPILKQSRKNLFGKIKNFKKRKDRKWVVKNKDKFSWSHHAAKVLEVFRSPLHHL